MSVLPTLDSKKRLRGYLAFGARICNGYCPPDLNNMTPYGVWAEWRSHPHLMKELQAAGAISMSYGGGEYTPFTPDHTNCHRALALACFLHYQPQGLRQGQRVMVTAPHASGGQFEAAFFKSGTHHVSYITDTGCEVKFEFENPI